MLTFLEICRLHFQWSFSQRKGLTVGFFIVQIDSNVIFSLAMCWHTVYERRRRILSFHRSPGDHGTMGNEMGRIMSDLGFPLLPAFTTSDYIHISCNILEKKTGFWVPRIIYDFFTANQAQVRIPLLLLKWTRSSGFSLLVALLTRRTSLLEGWEYLVELWEWASHPRKA